MARRLDAPTEMSSHIHVTGLFTMPHHVRELRPTHLISIIQPELQPHRPPEIPAERHLRVAVHDVSQSDGFSVLIQPQDVRDLIDFAREWVPEDGSLLVHCYAGVSRSSAAALVAHTLKTGDPEASAQALRLASPHAWPNRRIVAVADDELALGGTMIEAIEKLVPPRLPLEEETLASVGI